MTMNEWNFVHEKVDQIDIKLFDMNPQQAKFNDTHCLAKTRSCVNNCP